MSLGRSETWESLPLGIDYISEQQAGGWDKVFALIGELRIPVMASDEIDSSYLVKDKNGLPLRIVEPASIG